MNIPKNLNEIVVGKHFAWFDKTITAQNERIEKFMEDKKHIEQVELTEGEKEDIQNCLPLGTTKKYNDIL